MDIAEQNRQRYQLILDRRRALHEIHKLTERIRSHVAWPQGLHDVMLEQTLEEVLHTLARNAAQARYQVLLRDVQTLYRALVMLSRLWHRLEEQGEVEPQYLEALSRVAQGTD